MLQAFFNFFSVKIIYDVLALTGWVLLCAAFVYGLELAGIQKFLDRLGYRNADPEWS